VSTTEDPIGKVAREISDLALTTQRLLVRSRADKVLVEDEHHTSFIALVDGYHMIKGDKHCEIFDDLSGRDAAWLHTITSMSIPALMNWLAKVDQTITYPPAIWLARYMIADISNAMWRSWRDQYKKIE
jgi:hypothetical protein